MNENITTKVTADDRIKFPKDPIVRLVDTLSRVHGGVERVTVTFNDGDTYTYEV